MSCKHFGICGGCRLQDIPYPEQLALKEKKIAELALRGELNTTIKAINHFPFWYYRNKMEYTFSRDQGRLICGLHRQDQRRAVFNVEECPIFSEDLSVILNAVREFLASKNYAAYDTFTHQGFLRHLILRETKFTKQLMIALVTSSQDTLDEDGFLKSLQSVSLQNKIHSIFRITNDSFGDAVVFQQKKCLYQDDFIKENLDGISFRVYVDSFFQTNPHGITSLYRKLVDYAPLTRQDKVFDFFCGMGTITLFLASKADFIWGVELEKSAV
jgi:tRNA/tmRNA/rRNA uracil-C5-methylase (TrmA/RlmC/RlmD family)